MPLNVLHRFTLIQIPFFLRSSHSIMYKDIFTHRIYPIYLSIVYFLYLSLTKQTHVVLYQQFPSISRSGLIPL